jgi:plastocyanin
MDAEGRKKIIISVIVFAVVAAGRIGFMLYERRDTGTPVKQQPTYSTNLDDYVTPRKIVPYDLESAKKELAGKPVWVKAGNQIPYYHYDAASHNVNFKHEAGLLPPLDKLQVQDVFLQKITAAVKSGQVSVVQKQIMTVFERPGEPGSYAVSIGLNTGDDYTFGVNDIFFFDDPHELYKHWPADVWSAIGRHEATRGMNELQATFALGTNMSVSPGDYGSRTVEYTNAGKPVTVTFEKNKAITVAPGKAE